jgi:hypothetical protein
LSEKRLISDEKAGPFCLGDYQDSLAVPEATQNMEIAMYQKQNGPQIIVVESSRHQRYRKPWRPWYSRPYYRWYDRPDYYRPWYRRYWSNWDVIKTVLITIVGTILCICALDQILAR